MIPDLNIAATVTRTLTLTGRVVAVNDSAGSGFMCSLTPPATGSANDGSPRSRPPSVMRMQVGVLGTVASSLKAGCRVSLHRALGRPYENIPYELLETPTEFRVGPSAQGLRANVAPVGVLYPYPGTLREQDGTSVGAISVAIWEDREQHQATGTYEELSGEAPIEFAGQLENNRWISLGSLRYRILTSVVDLEGPRVRFTARVSNA